MFKIRGVVSVWTPSGCSHRATGEAGPVQPALEQPVFGSYHSSRRLLWLDNFRAFSSDYGISKLFVVVEAVLEVCQAPYTSTV
jgi:hypothetical protein